MIARRNWFLRGFSLLELLIVIVIVGIMAAIALPSYRDYVTRGNLVTATNGLSALRIQMEQYYQDNRTYAAVGSTFTPPCVTQSGSTAYPPFTIACSNITLTSYTITATGSGQVAGFAYTINQAGVQTTAALPSNWGTAPQSCWITKKGQTC